MQQKPLVTGLFFLASQWNCPGRVITGDSYNSKPASYAFLRTYHLTHPAAITAVPPDSPCYDASISKAW